VRACSIINSKGQIVIPVNLRKRYGLKEGTTIVFQEDRGRLVLEPSNYAEIYALQGRLEDFPLEGDLAKERRAEQDCCDAGSDIESDARVCRSSIRKAWQIAQVDAVAKIRPIARQI
jgi:AbrB family looped-hinge helix DNA binding protein